MSFKARVFLFLVILLLLISISANSETWKESLDQADSLYQSQDLHSAIVSTRKALALAEKQFLSEDTTLALILHRLGAYNHLVTNYAEAESSYLRSLAIRVKTYGYNHIDVCKSLTNLAELYRTQGRYAEAEPLGEKALLTREKILDPKHRLWSTILLNHATLQHDVGKYTRAEALYRRALTVLPDASKSEHPRVGRILRNLANLYSDQGKYSEAEPLYMKALAILEKALTPEHPDVAYTLNDFALCYRDQGRYAEAEPLYLTGQLIVEKAYGPEHINVGRFLNNRAELYCDWGRFSEAEPLYQRALTILVKALGPNHVDVAANLNSLALLYRAEGEYAKAEKLYRRALSIYEKALGSNHPSVAKSLNNLASLCCDDGRCAEAESLYTKALEITKRARVPEHPEAARSLRGLADLCGRNHKYEEQRLLYQQAVTIFKNALSPIHPEVAGVLERLSQYHRLLNNSEASLDASQRAFQIRLANFRNNVGVLSERDALTYCQFVRNSTNNYLSCLFDADVKKVALSKQTSRIVFASKGQVSDEIFWRRRSLAIETDSTILVLADSLRYSQSQLSELFVQGPGGETSDAYRQKLDSLGHIAERLESDLSRKSASFRRREEYRDVSVDRISDLLPERTALVEFLKYDYLQLETEKPISRYLAVVLQGNGNSVITDLGEATAIDSLVSDYRKHMLRVSSLEHLPLKKHKDEYDRLARKLYKTVIQPVEEHIRGKGLVFIAPDGSLNLISFAGLIDSDGMYLIENLPIHYLSAARDLVLLQQDGKSGHGLFALGGPDYGSKAEKELSEIKSGGYSPGEVSPHRYRGMSTDRGYLEEIDAKPLPDSRKEVEEVAKLWKAKDRGPAVVCLGSEASEENFKSKAPGKQAIHLATHGYYLLERYGSMTDSSGWHSSRQFVGQNPLLLSGLLFAGANLRGRSPGGFVTDDGILTACEVSAMDLEGTDLVVLSACETGLGKVEQGEGVYGLRRALQMAGARTVVSALWPVSDKTTAEMMTQLYAESEKSLPERIRETQLAQIKKLRSEGFSDHPYNWAAFIALGDWR